MVVKERNSEREEKKAKFPIDRNCNFVVVFVNRNKFIKSNQKQKKQKKFDVNQKKKSCDLENDWPKPNSKITTPIHSHQSNEQNLKGEFRKIKEILFVLIEICCFNLKKRKWVKKRKKNWNENFSLKRNQFALWTFQSQNAEKRARKIQMEIKANEF